MNDIQNYGAFLGAIVIFQLIPGPGTLTILGNTARHGTRAGFASVAGTVAGGLLCMAAASCGLQAVLLGRPQMVHALQWAGSAYLAWMGWCLMRRRAGTAPELAQAPSLWQHATRSMAVSLTNPKVILFYFALFPLFLGADAAPATLGAMVLHVTGISIAYQGGLVLAGNAVARRLRGLPAVRRAAHVVTGVGMIGFAVALAAGVR